MIFIIHLFISASFAQWIDMPDCPYGMQYVGNECQNAFGQIACPVGYYFDSVQGKCSASQQTNTNCPQGTTASLNEFGQPICETINETITNESYNNSIASKSRIPLPTKIRACESAHTRAKRICQPTNTTQIPNKLQQLSNQFSVFKDTGNTLQACESARNIASMNIISNVQFSAQCLSSAKSCANACDTSNAPSREREELKNFGTECSSYQESSSKGLNQAQLNARTYLNSKACAEIASGDCKGSNAQYISSCIQYCAQNNNKSTAQCKVVNQGCLSPEFYQENYTFCECLKNPVDSSCNQIRFSDLKTSSLSANDQGILAAIASQDFYSNDENAMNALESQNKQNSGLALAQKSGSNGSSLNLSGSAVSIPQGDRPTEQPYRGNSNEGSAYSHSNSYGSMYPNAYQERSGSDSLKIQYENNGAVQKQIANSLHQKTQAQIEEEKQIIANAFKRKNTDFTKTPPTIYYIEAERGLASEPSSSNKKTILWLAILVIVTVVALHRFMQNK